MHKIIITLKNNKGDKKKYKCDLDKCSTKDVEHLLNVLKSIDLCKVMRMFEKGIDFNNINNYKLHKIKLQTNESKNLMSFKQAFALLSTWYKSKNKKNGKIIIPSRKIK